MSDTKSLIEMLKSDDARIRYDACEKLSIMIDLPTEAIDALYPLTIDENQDVADAAQRALALHAELASQPELPPTPLPEQSKPSWNIALLGGISPLLVAIGTIMPILSWEGYQASWICIVPFGLGVVGGYLGQVVIMAITKQADRGVIFISALGGGLLMGICPTLIF